MSADGSEVAFVPGCTGVTETTVAVAPTNGTGAPLTNQDLATRGDAALALDLLSGNSRIVWLVPALPLAGAPPPGGKDHAPQPSAAQTLDAPGPAGAVPLMRPQNAAEARPAGPEPER